MFGLFSGTGENPIKSKAFWLLALALVVSGARPVAGRQEKQGAAPDSVGFTVSKHPTAKDVGLPVYPGAREHTENWDDSAGVQMGMWGGGSGFKVAVLKLQSDDSKGRIEAFYGKALAKYGKVLDCSDPSQGLASKGGSKSELDCEADRPQTDEIVLKAGTKQKQHVVAIRPKEAGSYVDLVYVEQSGSD